MLIAIVCSWCFFFWGIALDFMLTIGSYDLSRSEYWKFVAFAVAAPVSIPLMLAFSAVVSLINFRAK